MEFKTKSEKFVQKKQATWKELKSIILKISGRNFKKLSEKEVKHFPRLYRMVCTDLAEAKMLKLSPDVIHYLNSLVGQAHKYLYSFPAMKKGAVGFFFRYSLPNVLIKNWKFVGTSVLLFFGSYLITFALVVKKPGLASTVIPTSLLEMMEDSYSKSIKEERAASAKSLAAAFYIRHNISIAFACFAFGIFFGIGSIYFLIYNGLVLGSITGYIVAIGHGDNFFNFVTAHSVFELTGIAISGAAGILLGYSIINPGKYYRKDWLNIQKSNIFTLVCAATLLIFTAAFIEGFISPSTLPYFMKFTIFIISSLFILIYFFIYPLSMRKRGMDGL